MSNPKPETLDLAIVEERANGYSRDLFDLIAEVRKLREENERLCVERDEEKTNAILMGEAHDASCAEEARLRDVVHDYEQRAVRLSIAIGSPKDVDRLDEAVPLVLASYRSRGETAEAERNALRERVTELEAALRLAEWGDEDSYDGVTKHHCPICASSKEYGAGHDDGCPIGAALKPAPTNQQEK